MYNPVCIENNILTDITKESRLSKRVNEEIEHNRSVVRILSNPEEFQNFVNDIQLMFRAIWLELNQERGQVDKVLILRHLHTIKGSISSYGFIELSKQVHAIETTVSSIDVNIATSLKEELKGETRNLMKNFKLKVDELKALIPYNFTNVKEVRINPNKLDKFKWLLIKKHDNLSLKQIEQAFDDLYKEPITHHFIKLKQTAEELAGSNQKKVRIKLTGEKTEVNMEKIRPALQNMIHLVRNAVDHGLEYPEERSTANKPDFGQIHIEAAVLNKDLRLTISDDGKGIDAEKIKVVALKKNLINEDQLKTISESDAINLIFEPGFSTRSKVTELSGRGIGMNAIRDAVTNLGGTINILTMAGQGTTYEIRIPDCA